MSSRWKAAGLVCLLLGTLLQPGLVLADGQSRILFLHLHIEQDGSVRVLGSRNVPGKLKTPKESRGRVKFELQRADGNTLWSGAVEDPRVRHFEIENPPGSGNLERRTHTVPEAEFMVRVPVHGAAVRFVVFEDEPAKANGAGRGNRKILLDHPLPPPAQKP